MQFNCSYRKVLGLILTRNKIVEYEEGETKCKERERVYWEINLFYFCIFIGEFRSESIEARL